MLYDDSKPNNPEPYDPKVINDMPVVTASGGQKSVFIIWCILTIGLFYIYKIVKMNELKSLQMKINQSASNIDVQLQKRFDTLNKLVSAVKSQAKFDKETLESIARLRSGKGDATQKDSDLNQVGRAINVVVEAYPQLGVDKSVQTLMGEYSIDEKEIGAARRLYNSDATRFNSLIYTFPVNVVVAGKNYKAIKLFATSTQARKDVDLSF